ncbi:MAG: DUF4350 domain-containing protein [Pseudomonadota bacterium]|nr:DUF4350 domain-containing protein [Pseudomonadota bacterium]
MLRLPRTKGVLTLLAVLLAACSTGKVSEEAAPKHPVGLFSTLPIYWGEGDRAAILDGSNHSDWVRDLIEQRFDIEPLDTVEPDAIDGLDRIIMAQPRPLAPSENVALDNWVRAGGRLLIFADPLLTRHSDFALGDRRRPQDVVLLSPILTRWGLELRFDDAQPSEERLISASGNQYPVNLAGQFVATGDGKCTISEAGLFAWCSVGNGRVTLMADAAILDSEETAATSAQRQVLLATLIGDALN